MGTLTHSADEITLQDVVQNSGLMEKLGQPGQFTLFAPTNEAFEKLGIDVLERIQSDPAAVQGRSRKSVSCAFQVHYRSFKH